jgi:capsular exopolysaccharide synthesis family protein
VAQQTQLNSAGQQLDYKRYLLLVLRYWYVVLISLLLFLGWGYYKNKYSPRTYQVAMTLLIKENQGQENSAALLFNNPLIKPTINYYNEPYLLKADPLVAEVVQKLGFTTSYFLQGNIKTTEIFPGPAIVFTADTINGSFLPYGSRFWFQILNKRQFKLKQYSEDESAFDENEAIYEFGSWVKLDGQNVLVDKNTSTLYSEANQQPYIIQFNHPASLTAEYTSKLNIIWVEEGAAVLSLSTIGEIPEKEIYFLNALSQAYIEKELTRKNQNASNTINFISDQLVQIGDSLDNIEQRLQNFKQENIGVGLGDRANVLFEKLQGLELEKNRIVLKEKYFNYISDYISKGLEATDLIVPSSLGIEDPILNNLIDQLVKLQLQKEELKRSTQASNPILQTIDERIGDLKQNLLKSIDAQRGSTDISRKSVNQEITLLERDIRQLPRSEREYINIQRVYKLSESLYNYLLEKRAEASITRASATSDISIVNPPKQVSGAITPDVRGNYTKSFMLGVGIPLGLLFLLFYFNNKIQSKEDLKKYTSIPLLGVVGHNPVNNNLAVTSKPKSAIAESFRAIRSNLNFFTPHSNSGAKVFLITSSISGEGKTFCSMNLASVFAYSGLKTLIVGADMRKPKIYQDFGLSNETGLSNYLAGVAAYTDIIQPTSVQHLDLISGGIIPPNPSELLLGQRMQELIKLLSAAYDVVIIDSPPHGLVTDSLLLMPFVDHTIYVVRQTYTTISLLRNIEGEYSSGRLKNISILLNDVKASRDGYGYGYGYYEEDENNRKRGLAKYLKLWT